MAAAGAHPGRGPATRAAVAVVRGLQRGRSLVVDDFLVSQLFRVQDVVRPASLVAYGIPLIRCLPGSRMTFGERVVLTSRRTMNELSMSQPVSIRTVSPTAIVEIGDDTGLSGTVICAARRVSIGKRVLIGSNTLITDSDHHPVRIDPVADRRYSERGFDTAREVVIADDVFIGVNCLVLKGSSMGRGSVLGAGSVLSGSIPPYTIAAGNPAIPLASVHPRSTDAQFGPGAGVP